ncbi:MAG: SRPBCC family protein [Bacillota bacterium]
MAVSNIKAIFQSDIQKIWDTVTSLEKYAWRSDLSKVEILNDKQFVEYTKEGYPTTFTITLNEPYKRWEFDMENGNMKGHWSGIFTQKGEQTEIDFTEDVIAKKLLMKPFVKAYLKKQQAQYVLDLEKALSR